MSEGQEAEEIWQGTVDQGTFHCRVIREGTYEGSLVVAHVASGEVLLTERVILAFGAIFGPDLGDLAYWYARSTEVIDEWLASHPQ